jgi:hypothetical protein
MIAPARHSRVAWAVYGTAALLIVGLVGGIALANGMFDSGRSPGPTPLPPAAPLTGFRPSYPEERAAELSTTPMTSLRVSVTRSYPFTWPVTGPITSRIGPDHPTGIDIGLDASRTQGIRASAAGTVAFPAVAT